MRTGDVRARLIAAAVCVFVPGALALVWLTRTPPPPMTCLSVVPSALHAAIARWQAGAAYAIACAVHTELFVLVAIPWTLAALLWPATGPAVLVGCGVWLAVQPCGQRWLAFVQLLGWVSLLGAIVGIGSVIAWHSTPRPCF